MELRHALNQILVGDCLTVLKTLPSESVHACITSPPYWNLRDYEADGQIGLEKTPQEYVTRLVEVFNEVRRVLHPTGTLWLILGDTYAPKACGNIKRKDLVGIPWRVAFALQDAGWWLRAENIWSKGNPMPEPVTDRTTIAHEHVFHFAKSESYYYDRWAILEPFVSPNEGRDGSARERQRNRGGRSDGFTKPNGIDPSTNGGRNKRSVWNINATRFKEAHFATFPPALPRLCVRAGTSYGGCCARCGAPYLRIVDRAEGVPDDVDDATIDVSSTWTPSCTCDAGPTRPCVVLDPFAGSGTTLEVAKWDLRDFIGIELNSAYAEIAERRVFRACATSNQVELFDLSQGLKGS